MYIIKIKNVNLLQQWKLLRLYDKNQKSKQWCDETEIYFCVSCSVHTLVSWQHHINYNSVSRSKSRERETEKKESENARGRSKERKEEKDRKDRKRVSAHSPELFLGKKKIIQKSFVFIEFTVWSLILVFSVLLQDHAAGERETSQESKRRKEENGTSKFFICEVEEVTGLHRLI